MRPLLCNIPHSDVCNDMNTTYSGLSAAQAAQRLAQDGPNEIPGDGPRHMMGILIDVIKEPMFLLLIGAACIYLLLGDPREALVLSSSIVIIIVITVLQERRTESTLTRLRDLTSPRALVIRDGDAIRIAGRDVVVGDIVLLREGDRVPADARLVESTALSVDESILTGESLPVDKSADNGATRAVYSASMVVSGYGTAEVTATGANTQIGHIGAALHSVKPEITPLYQQVHRMVSVIATAAIIVCIVVAIVYAFTMHAWLSGMLAGITVAMGILPEEFPVVLTIFLAMGAWRISRRNVLTRRIPAIESLGAATVLAVDKTGTLTENRMRIAMIVTLQQHCDLRAADAMNDDVRAVLGIAVAASERDAFDPMERAIHEAAQRLIMEQSQRLQSLSLIREYDLTPQLLAVTHVWSDGQSRTCNVACKGAPETVMQLCKLDEDNRKVWLTKVNALAAQGLRVLGVARGVADSQALPGTPAEFTLHFMGLLCLADPVRATVPAALEECKQAGIRVVMITGDHAGTAATIARQAGFGASDKVLNCSDMDDMNNETLRKHVADTDIYARAKPQHKLRLVQALKASHEVVVMTGDGVNDAPALKAAHVGVAMGSRGTDVAREAASLVLMDDDFASLVAGVRLGRRIYDNIRNAMHYLVAVHIPLAGIGLLPVLLGWPLVFYPVHVLFLEFVIDPACSFVFEADAESADIMHRRPRAVNESLFSIHNMWRSIVMGLTSLLIALLAYDMALTHLAEYQARALCFASLVLTNITIMLFSRANQKTIVSTLVRKNAAFWIIVLVATGALAISIYIPAAAELFHFAAPPPATLGLLVAINAIAIVVTAGWQALFNRKEATR
ncbi:MAG TPA: cation-translocating P-type ATPase [Steroidobacteraceae bacterium]|nr:cation-translocating P-type ATPase [Steroidobacteraceae bacterium]